MDTTVISENKGWIKIHRKLLDNPIAKKPDYISIFIFLLLKANHKTNDIILEGVKTTIKRGQLLTSILSISGFFNLSTSTISRILKYLETERTIERKSTNKYSIVTILNYDLYQNPETFFENKPKAERKQKETNNNDKNEEEFTNTGKNPELVNLIRTKADKLSISLQDPNRSPIKFPWQDKARRYAESLELEFTGGLDKRWYKMFKDAHNGKNLKNIEIAYSYIIDHPKLITTEDKVKMFFYIFNHGLNYQLKNSK